MTESAGQRLGVRAEIALVAFTAAVAVAVGWEVLSRWPRFEGKVLFGFNVQTALFWQTVLSMLLVLAGSGLAFLQRNDTRIVPRAVRRLCLLIAIGLMLTLHRLLWMMLTLGSGM